MVGPQSWSSVFGSGNITTDTLRILYLVRFEMQSMKTNHSNYDYSALNGVQLLFTLRVTRDTE